MRYHVFYRLSRGWMRYYTHANLAAAEYEVNMLMQRRGVMATRIIPVAFGDDAPPDQFD